MYEIFDHPADMGVRGTGKTWNEAYTETALAMFSVMGDLKQFQPETEVEFTCRAHDKEELLVDFLNHLLYQSSIHKCVFSQIDIHEWSENEVRGIARGEKIKQNHKACLKTEVKGATYSELSVHQDGDLFKAQCIIDL